MYELKTVWLMRVPACSLAGGGPAWHQGGKGAGSPPRGAMRTGLRMPSQREQGGLLGDSHVWLELYRKRRGTARCARGHSLRSPVCANTQEQGLDRGGWGALACGVNLRAGQELHLGAELKRQRNLSNA